MRIEIRLSDVEAEFDCRLDQMVYDEEELTNALKRAINLGKAAGICDLNKKEIEDLWESIDEKEIRRKNHKYEGSSI